MSLYTLETKLEWAGGDALGRINRQKLRSLQAAMKNDYNSRLILTPRGEKRYCLINTYNLKTDYDREFISIEHDAKLEPGDVFHVLDNDTRYMVYLPDLVETAYLHAHIIRCRYTIEINDNLYWMYFQGPVETDIRWNLNHHKSYNEPNLSGTIFIKNTEDTRNFFKRFTKFKIEGEAWEVQATDHISVPGIIEVEIQETFENVAEELPDICLHIPGMLGCEEIPHLIIGDSVVNIGDTVGYTLLDSVYEQGGEWSVDNENVEIEEVLLDGRVCKVKVRPEARECFTIRYGKYSKHIKLRHKHPEIKGPETVYPYSKNKYTVLEDDGEFIIHSNLARIIKQGNGECIVEVLTGKKGNFTLCFKHYMSGDTYELPIKIGSLI